MWASLHYTTSSGIQRNVPTQWSLNPVKRCQPNHPSYTARRLSTQAIIDINPDLRMFPGRVYKTFEQMILTQDINLNEGKIFKQIDALFENFSPDLQPAVRGGILAFAIWFAIYTAIFCKDAVVSVASGRWSKRFSRVGGVAFWAIVCILLYSTAEEATRESLLRP